MPAVDNDVIAAAAEYERNADMKDADVKQLRLWLETQAHLPHVTDEMLHKFHHSCYFDLERTKACIDAYYTIRTNTPELFANRDVTRPELAQALQVMYYVVMPTPDPRGYRIICNSLRDPDPTKYGYAETNKLLMMTIDGCHARYGAEPGIVIVSDMTGAKLSHLARCSLSVMRKLTLYNQDASPVRLTELHLLNTVSWVGKILALIRPFVKKELLDLVHYYTSDTNDELYKQIPKQYLPKDYGGEGPTLEELHDENTKYLESMRATFAEEEKARVDERKRVRGGEQYWEPEAAMMRLELD